MIHIKRSKKRNPKEINKRKCNGQCHTQLLAKTIKRAIEGLFEDGLCGEDNKEDKGT
jgi:hypothetical protein